MALTNQALTTVSAVQGEINHSDEQRIERLINTVSESMSVVAGGRVWYYSTAHVHDVKGWGDVRIFVPAPPISSITSVVLRDATGDPVNTYSSSNFAIESDGVMGSILHETGWPKTYLQAEGYSVFPSDPSVSPLIRVTYAGGWVTPWQVDPRNSANLLGSQTRTLPYDLEDACIREVVSRLRGLGRDLTIESQTSDAAVTSFRNPRRGLAGLSEQATEVARRYWLGPR